MISELREIADKRWFLAESGLWHEKRQSFFFVNIFDGELWEYGLKNEKLRMHKFDCIVSAVVQRKNNDLILVTQKGIGIYDVETENFEVKVHPNEVYDKQTRYNDCKCDPAGRLYAGTMDLEGKPGKGRLYCIEPDWSWRIVLDQVDYSNGLVWIKDKMYYTDTYKGEVYRYDYDVKTGSFKNKRILCTFPAGQPDGMAADSKGNLWIALWGGCGIACVDPESGNVVGKVETTAQNVSSICFGGAEVKEVLITTAQKDLTKEELKNYSKAGCVYIGKSDVEGIEFYKFP